MPWIECKLGQSENDMPGRTYVFERDEYGRWITEVTDEQHRALFLHVEHFQEVERHPNGATTELEQALAEDDVDDVDDEDTVEDDDDDKPLVPTAVPVQDEAENAVSATEPPPDPYAGQSKADLADEAVRRGLTFQPNWNAYEIKKLLLEDDERQAAAPGEGDLSKMSRDELKNLATSRGIAFHTRISTPKLLERILEAEDEG